MLKRLLLATVALVAFIAIIAPGGAAATTGVCNLNGGATVSPGLTTQTKGISYSFGGKLNACQGTGAVKNGTISATGSGTGSCSGNTTTGTGTISWNTGQTSSISFSTKGTGAYVGVTGKVTSGLFVGQKANANLLFTTTKPQLCLSTGLTNPGFSGVAHIGF